jgi:hypothetical protein
MSLLTFDKKRVKNLYSGWVLSYVRTDNIYENTSKRQQIYETQVLYNVHVHPYLYLTCTAAGQIVSVSCFLSNVAAAGQIVSVSCD